MQKRNFLFVFKSFLAWRVAITLIAIFAIKYVPMFSQNFFGGKYINYITNPLFYGWANFDGEHYLSIAMFGYKNLQQAFFPAYPIAVGFFSSLFGSNLEAYLWSGIILSNIFFLGSLIILWKIVRLDYSEKISNLTVILLLIFPTSFYFGAVYTESLFLFTSLYTYYLYRKNRYLLSGLIGIVMTLTRLYGVFIIFMIFVDILVRKVDIVNIVKQKIYLIGISISGVLAYMWYCWKNYGDSLAFYNLQTLVGEQRSKELVLLPQVFYRYIAKIIPNLDWNNLPSVFSIFLELSVGVIFLFLIVYSFRKIRWDYWIYIVLGYLVPTLTGSFSSLPRYVIILFPAFIVASVLLEKINYYLRLGIYMVSSIIAIVSLMLFFRGYWIS